MCSPSATANRKLRYSLTPLHTALAFLLIAAERLFRLANDTRVTIDLAYKRLPFVRLRLSSNTSTSPPPSFIYIEMLAVNFVSL